MSSLSEGRRAYVGRVHGGRLARRHRRAVLPGPDTQPTGWRVSHIEHKLSISSGAGVTIARARIDTSFNGLVGRVRPSASAAGSVAPPSPAPPVRGIPDDTVGLVSTGHRQRDVGGRRAAPTCCRRHASDRASELVS